MNIRKKVTGIVLNDKNEILVCKYSNNESKGWWRDFPWWWVNSNENDHQWLYREIYEEIWINKNEIQLLFQFKKRYLKIYEKPIKKIDNNTIKTYHWKFETFFALKILKSQLNLNISNEFNQYKWIKLNEVNKYIENMDKIKIIESDLYALLNSSIEIRHF